MLKFEWSRKKAEANVKKHGGVTFEEAREVFDDDHAVVEVDDSHSAGELRYNIIGASGQRLLFVVYVERASDVIRIISAREVEPYERLKYYEEG